MSGNIKTTRAERRQVAADNSKHGEALEAIPRELWPVTFKNVCLTQVWRSRRFLVQVYENEHPDVVARISVNRTTPGSNIDRWEDGITWDDLQDIKGQLGFGFGMAVEIYPAANRIVNVANMRHLWVLVEELPFAWR